MPNDSKTYILDDQCTDKDALDFTPYVETLADIVKTGNTPLTIGVFGTWGSGKTSLMKMVKNQVPDDFTVAWFDAWKYDKEETLWRAFILSVLTAVRSRVKEGQPTEDLDYLETMLYRAIEIEKTGGVTIDLTKLGGSVAKGVVQLGLSFIPGGAVLSEFVKKVQELGAESLTDEVTDAIQRERTKIQIEQVRFLEQFQSKFRILVEQHISNNGGRLVVFVDDLDRCLPEKAIEVLEAIKLFLDVKDCIFVLGVDQDVIARGIEMKYREFSEKQNNVSQQHFTIEGVRYLEKIIQLPFQIPPVEQADIGDFVYGLSAEWPHKECPKVFSEGLGDNPRQIKRTVNVFLMLWKLAEKRKDKLQGRVKPIRLAKVVAIQAIYPELYALLKETPRYLRELEEYYRNELNDQVVKEGRELAATDPSAFRKLVEVAKTVESYAEDQEKSSENQTKHELPPTLAPFVSKGAIQRILTLHSSSMSDANFINLPPEELRLYFTLTRRVETPQAVTFGTAIIFAEPQMIRIPTGKFLMGSTQKDALQAMKMGLNQGVAQWEQPQRSIELSEYFIGKYPITMREYQVFIKDAKHPPPRGWDSDQFPSEMGDHPVVLISWDDAMAYCKWLSNKSGKQYRLPTEAEWEKAARGTEAWIWSWGNKFDKKNANTKETGIGNTTSVAQFSPNGDSPYSCADMIGNVWEWCADWFLRAAYYQIPEYNNKDPQGPQESEKGNDRVLRGGCFLSSSVNARCARRFHRAQEFRNDDIGFRVACSPAKLEREI
jgi:formylglycine-generating enzyme required for sulfatase activity